jgi:DNA (cytosine-5)-methyltransferase 1
VVWANEFVPLAAETYRLNHPGTVVSEQDIRTVSALDILRESGLGAGDIDVLDGSPPCQSFSTSGRREHNWGRVTDYSDTRQRTDDLFFEYARLVKALQPRTFIAENVSGLVKGVSKGYFKQILRALRDCGYCVETKLLDAQWLGVPQRRARLFFVGVRDDLHRQPRFPTPLPYRYSVGDVLPYVRRYLGSGRPNNWRDRSEPYGTIMQSAGSLSPTAYLSTNGWVEVQQRDTTCLEKRRLTIDEVKLLSAFPADFVLLGTFEQQWERLGRAVPPLMMRAVARALYEGVFA